MKSDVWTLFENLLRKFNFLLQSDNNNSKLLYMQTDIRFWSYFPHLFFEWEMFQTKVVEEIKTHFSLNN
jgi:hypothetical protein